MAVKIGKIERTLRVVGGIIFIYASNVIFGVGSIMAAALGLYAIVTGFLGDCFIYNLLPNK